MSDKNTKRVLPKCPICFCEGRCYSHRGFDGDRTYHIVRFGCDCGHQVTTEIFDLEATCPFCGQDLKNGHPREKKHRICSYCKTINFFTCVEKEGAYIHICKKCKKVFFKTKPKTSQVIMDSKHDYKCPVCFDPASTHSDV